jgi:hypothetical protein
MSTGHRVYRRALQLLNSSTAQLRGWFRDFDAALVGKGSKRARVQ